MIGEEPRPIHEPAVIKGRLFRRAGASKRDRRPIAAKRSGAGKQTLHNVIRKIRKQTANEL